MTTKPTKYQKFQAETIHRSQIQNAPYNPRLISESARKALKRNLKRVGLLDTLVWNRLTGNLVSGHQRLSLLDELEGTQDYNITVAVVELSDKEEREQNIFFNSKSAQGQFDESLLAELLPDIDSDFAGLDALDLSVMGIGDMEPLPPEPEYRSPEQKQQRKEEMQTQRRKIADDADSEPVGSTYLTVSFSSIDAKESFLDKLNFPPDMRVIKGEHLSIRLLD